MTDEVVYFDRERLNLSKPDENGSRKLLRPHFVTVPASKRKLKKRSKRQTIKLHKQVVHCGLTYGVVDSDNRFGLNRFTDSMADYLRFK